MKAKPSIAPRRARLQIRLSTCIILVLAAGGFIWLNLEGSYRIRKGVLKAHPPNIARFEHVSGWPFTIYRLDEYASGIQDHELLMSDIRRSDYAPEYDRHYMGSMNVAQEEWIVSAMALNACIGLVLLALFAAATEYFFRLRSDRRPATHH
ncbi:MAG: hypothetical protein M5U26_15220 [Planctomycetota bacterium]|nr:hypothetical protein [Planctomycetota bacterium]